MNAKLKNLSGWLGRSAWSLLFYAYAILAAPVIGRLINGTIQANETHHGIGLAILTIIALGLLGLIWNRHAFTLDQKQTGPPIRGLMPMIFIAWILHCTVCLILLFSALNCLGMDLPGSNKNGMGAFPFAMFLLGAIVAEFVALYAMFAPLPRSPRHWKAIVSEIGLFAFSCAAYTFYTAIMEPARADDTNWPLFISELVAITILFLFFYLSIELPSLLEALRMNAQGGQRRRIWGSMAMAVILANAPIIRANMSEGKRFSSLGAALKTPDRAVKLYLQNQKLDILPENIRALSKLKILNLTENKLWELPDSIGELADLEELHFAKNRLTRLPATLGQLCRLRVMVGFQNYVREFPPELAAATNLTRIHFSFNDLQVLTPAIGSLANLQSLNLGWNSLSNLPPEIGLLRQLTDLNLAHNHLAALPSEIAGLKSLRRLNLTDNPIDDAERKRIRSLLPRADIEF